jgi:hypothetical protein
MLLCMSAALLSIFLWVANPAMRMSTSLLALCCQSVLDAALEKPIRQIASALDVVAPYLPYSIEVGIWIPGTSFTRFAQ